MLSSALVRFALLWLGCFSAHLADPTRRERVGLGVPWITQRVLRWIAGATASTVLLLDIGALGAAAGTTMWLAECGVAASLVAVGGATMPRFSLAVAPTLLLFGAVFALWPA